jgi:membrane protein DedA with SNARE-associated domain
VLGENWYRVGHFLHYLDYAVAVAFVAGAILLFWRWRRARSSEA